MSGAARTAPWPVTPGPLVVLVGTMGVGKSTVGRLLAERLGVAHRDTDDDIVTGQGRAVVDLFREHGEAGFRALEKEAVRVALAEHDGVLSLGGGAVLDEGTRALLTGRHVVWLTMDEAEAVRRVAGDRGRPLLAAGDAAGRWAALDRARRPLYEQVAACAVTTDGRTPQEVTAAVLDTLERRGAAGTPAP